MRRATGALLALAIAACAPSVSDGTWVWCEAHTNEVMAAAYSLNLPIQPWIGQVEEQRRADTNYTRACVAAYEAR